jgi:hypothetical protein
MAAQMGFVVKTVTLKQASVLILSDIFASLFMATEIFWM